MNIDAEIDAVKRSCEDITSRLLALSTQVSRGQPAVTSLAKHSSQALALGPIGIECTGCGGRLPDLGRVMAEVRRRSQEISGNAG